VLRRFKKRAGKIGEEAIAFLERLKECFGFNAAFFKLRNNNGNVHEVAENGLPTIGKIDSVTSPVQTAVAAFEYGFQVKPHTPLKGLNLAFKEPDSIRRRETAPHGRVSIGIVPARHFHALLATWARNGYHL
jgi:hypothetical protein